MCFLRDMSAESALATLEQSLPHRDKIIGVGLDSDERDNPPVKFREVFARARAEGRRRTSPAGPQLLPDRLAHPPPTAPPT
jgi:adenine deaminase